MDLLDQVLQIMPAITEAGNQAQALQQTTEAEFKSDGSPVTEADRLANQIIVDYLEKHFSDDAILSEEITDNKKRLDSQRTWIIDPIDGTSAFVEGRDDWAVQVALAEGNSLVLGILFIPHAGRAYIGIPNHGAWIEEHGQRKTCHIPKNPENILLASRSKRNAEAMKQAKAILSDFTASSVSSVGVKVDHMLRGKGSVYVNPSAIHEWDYAAPAAVLIAAGGHATDFQAKPLPINSPTAECNGIIFSSVSDHSNIVQRLQALQQ